ncbi:MAG: hydantoinase/oxoprolinase family protein [Actinobacteria bacterium]|nr:hydantoinase/oxoprolinase family protein [Actinomycetota bacterium]
MVEISIVIGIDVGGTFTDFVLWQDGGHIIHKVLSTHPQPEIGVVNGLKELGLLPDETDFGIGPSKTQSADIIHGSTIATNALLERKGAKVALVTTRGFTDLIDIGRQNRPGLYSFWADMPAPLVDRDYRFGVDERIGSCGEVIRPVDVSGLSSLMRALSDKGINAVAVCFLFSFLNPEHEQVVENYLVDNGFFVSASYKILPEYREYERLSTTVVNAFVTPLVASYLAKLTSGMGEGLARNLRIMQSNGGLVSAMSAARQAVQTVLSGPAGGAVATQQLGKNTGIERLISFDMGGTSTDVSLVDGDIQFTTEFSIYGSPIKVPVIDIHTIGAGGGSIAWIDAGGALQVGPESAGSDPGPACYGRGEKPTITDANLVLGRLHPKHFLGGRQELDLEHAKRVLSRMADECGLDLLATADGVIRIAISNMEKAIRKISVERGYDPRDFTLIAFGGAGPMHACELAEAALIPRVLIPKIPGVFSAYGMTVSDVAKDYSKSVLIRQTDFTTETLENTFTPLLDAARADLTAEGFNEESMRLEKALDVRYIGQSFELTIPIAGFADDYPGAFHKMHSERYGHASPDEEIEVVGVRVRAIGLRDKPEVAMVEQAKEPVVVDLKSCTFFDGWYDAACYHRENLLAGHTLTGPALIFQLDTTTVIPPGWLAEVDRYGNLILQKENG